jgi:hypothetical protein
MRHHRLISILVLAAAGCSASGDMDPFDRPDATELPRTVADELADERDPALDGGGYGTVLIDLTSSMNTVRSSTGNTRCEDAKIMAKSYIDDFFNPLKIDGDGIAIWGFNNAVSSSDDVQPITTGYYTDATTAKDAVGGLSCEGSTPLADALCKGVNGDGETFTIDPMLDRMFVLTDGFENSSNGSCSGPSGSVMNPSTWQYKVMSQMVATGIMVDTRYWINPTILLSPDSIDAFAAADDEPFDPSLEELQLVADIEELPQAKIDQLMGAHHAAGGADDADSDCDIACQELLLFAEMAKASGGSWGVVKDDDENYPLEDAVDPATGPVHPSDDPPPPLDAEGV